METTACRQQRLERRDGYLVHPSRFVDSQFAPVYVLSFRGELFEATLAPLQAHIEASECFYKRLDHPYVSVTTLAQLRELKATARKLYADHVNTIEPFARTYCRGRAVVCENALQRGFATAVSWFLRSDVDRNFFDSIDEAVAWARRQIP